MIKDPEMDQIRMASYPNLEYSNLYNAICMLVSIIAISKDKKLSFILSKT